MPRTTTGSMAIGEMVLCGLPRASCASSAPCPTTLTSASKYVSYALCAVENSPGAQVPEKKKDSLSVPGEKKKEKDVLKAATQVEEEGDSDHSDDETLGVDEPVKVTRDRKSRCVAPSCDRNTARSPWCSVPSMSTLFSRRPRSCLQCRSVCTMFAGTRLDLPRARSSS